MNKLKGTFIANTDDIRPQYRSSDSTYLSQNAIYTSGLVRDNGLAASATIDQLSGQYVDAVSGIKEEAAPWYSDQVLPFDVTLGGTNENGAATAMKIFGIEILNEGGGVSIDDAVTEMQATFVARLVEMTRCFAAGRKISLARARTRPRLRFFSRRERADFSGK